MEIYLQIIGTRKIIDSTKDGYVRNCLVLNNGKSKHYFRHRLVMICFCFREDYTDFQVNHIDGNKLNNSVENLEWCTNQENRIHAVKTGLAARLKGETNPAHKLTEENVKNIINDLLNRVPVNEISDKYNCSKSTIWSIRAHRNWKYLTEGINFN